MDYPTPSVKRCQMCDSSFWQYPDMPENVYCGDCRAKEGRTRDKLFNITERLKKENKRLKAKLKAIEQTKAMKEG